MVSETTLRNMYTVQVFVVLVVHIVLNWKCDDLLKGVCNLVDESGGGPSKLILIHTFLQFSSWW